MQDESSTPQEEEEVEAHHRPNTGPEDPSRLVGREEHDEDDDEVEAHIRPHHGPEEPGRHF